MTHDSVPLDAGELLPPVDGGGEVELADGESDLADGVVLGEAVKVKDGQNEGLAHHLAVGDLKVIKKQLRRS